MTSVQEAGSGQPTRDGAVRRRGRPRRLSRAERRELGIGGGTVRPPRDGAGHGWLAGLVVLVALAALAGGGYALLYGLAHDRVPRNTSIGGIDVGGLDAAGARAVLDRRLQTGAGAGRGADAPLDVVGTDLQTRVTPSVAGLSYDVGLSVARAGATDSRDPRVLLRELFAQSSSRALVVRLDRAALARATAAIATGYDRPAREGSVAFAGTQVQTVDPLPGRLVDPAGLGTALVAAFQSRQPTVTVATRAVGPRTTVAGVRAAAQSLAGAALAGPVVLRVPGREVVFGVEQFVPALTVTADRAGRFAVGAQPAVLRQIAAPQLAQLEVAPQSATIRVAGDRAAVVPSTVGTQVPDPVLAAAVARAAVGRGAARSVPVTRVARPAPVTTAALQALGIRSVTGSATVTFEDRPGYLANIARASAALDGRIVRPGERLSFNRVVGERTAQRGYVQGIVIAGGRLGKTVGGGVAVAATALFNAGYTAGWAVPMRQAAGVFSGTAPDGRDATVSYPTIDLVIADDTPYGAYLQMTVTPPVAGHRGTVRAQLFSTPWFAVTTSISARSGVVDPGRATGSTVAGCVPSTGVPGFAVLVRRVVRRAGVTVESDARTVTYGPLPTVSCR